MHDRPHRQDPPLHADRATPEDPLLGRALALVRFLRERCPWDARQDPRSLRPYLLEEAHEVADAIDAADDAALRVELGDLLLNVAFQIVLAEEREAFATRDVVERLEAKMEARHPHIYGEAEEPPDWEALKVAERSGASPGTEGTTGGDGAPSEDLFAGLPSGVEPLSRALRTLDRAAAVGFEWPGPDGPLAKLEEEGRELDALLRAVDRASGPEHPPVEPAGVELAAIEEEVGDLLLAAVAVARAVGVHPANALLAAGAKFRRRFRATRDLASRRGVDWEAASLEELEALWREAKAEE